MRADAPLPSVEYADEPVTQWRLDAPLPSVEIILGVPEGMVIPDGVVANLTGSGLALAAVIVRPGLSPAFSGRGTVTAVNRVTAPAIDVLSGQGSAASGAALPGRLTGWGAGS